MFAELLRRSDVQRLAGIGASGQDRVVAEHLGVAVRGALLQRAADLADEAVDIDHQPALARPGAGPPRACQRLAQQPVELAHVPERERTQERAQRRRRRDPATQQPARAAGPQHVAVIDAVSAERHREDQRHHLAARAARARPLGPQPHQPLRERLDPQPFRDRRRQHNPGI